MKAEIIEVNGYQWVTCNGKLEIFHNRNEAIARAIELSPTNATYRTQ